MAPSSDRNLLDRLNALKQTSISLDKPANQPNLPVSLGPGLGGDEQPPSREDALSARLRTLRSSLGSRRAVADEVAPGAPSKSPDSQGGSVAQVKTTWLSGDFGVAEDPLFLVDDTAVDELLGDLDVTADVDQWDFDPGAESNKVSALLEKLRKDSSFESPATERDAANPKSGALDEDDSDGEAMTREVDDVLSRAVDEAELARKAEQQAPPHATPLEGESQGGESDAKSREVGDEDGTDTFRLPAVPTKLVDPVDSSQTGRESVDFENDIAARMVALKGFGSAVKTDALGLPSAPTFQPDDRPQGSRGRGRKGASGYTDEDQKSWCIVCLEDATVRCLGCDEPNVFCERCWTEMHMSPSSWFDHRGHKRVKFTKDDG